jgi:LDH2 family malate/lactate/ureidoglycolate dehydrogenase
MPPIASGVAIDSTGRPTRKPKFARQGAILPFGGYKGFGLAFVVQSFGVLARSALNPEKDDGYLFVVFKPDLLTDLDDFRSRERLHGEGIELDRQVYETLASLHPQRGQG